MSRDPHDPREFRQWAQCDDDGSVVSTHDIDAAVDTPDLRNPVELTNVGRDLTTESAQALLENHAEAVTLASAKTKVRP